MQRLVALGICFIGMIWTMAACSIAPIPVGPMPARGGQVGGGEFRPLPGSYGSAPRGTVPRLRVGPSDERPPWLRDLPDPLERHPAPEGWGGDQMAVMRIRPATG